MNQTWNWLLLAGMLMIGAWTGVGVALDAFAAGALLAALLAWAGLPIGAQAWWFLLCAAVLMLVRRRLKRRAVG